MSKLTRAIRDKNTDLAFKIIQYLDLEAATALLLFSLINTLLLPLFVIAHYVLRYDTKLSDWQFSYLALPENSDPLYKPVHLAAMQGDVAVLQALAKAGVDLNAHNYKRRTPLAMAIGNGHLPAAIFLLNQGVTVDEDVLFSVVRTPQCFPLFNELRSRGASVKCTLPPGELSYAPGGDLLQSSRSETPITLLLTAILSNYDEDHRIVAALLRAGANPNEVFTINQHAETALSICLRKGRYAMAVRLMQGGANVHAAADEWTQNYPRRQVKVEIFNAELVDAALKLAAANNLVLTTEQLGPHNRCRITRTAEKIHLKFDGAIPTAEVVACAPPLPQVQQLPQALQQPFLPQFDLRGRDFRLQYVLMQTFDGRHVLTQGMIVNETGRLESPQIEPEIVVPELPTKRLGLRGEGTFPC